MKKQILILALLIIPFLTLYSQEYNFNKKLTSKLYTASNGRKQSTVISNTNGNYKIRFSPSSQPQHSPIIDIYGDNEEIGYYAFLQNIGNQEFKGKLYECKIFYSTQREDGTSIYIAFDKSRIVICYQDTIIEYTN